MKNKVLVCITPQSNSSRLIDKGADIASTDGELHILHIERGDKIFETEDSAVQLQMLFDYGSSAGGIVHGMCSENVAKTIQKFALKYKISSIVLGESDKKYKNPENILSYIRTALPYIDIVIMERDVNVP